MIVSFADTAEADLDEIGDWIAIDDPIRAATFVYELRERCRLLGRYPNRFPSVREFENHSLRKLTVGGYLIFYVVTPDSVEIARIVHGSRDWMTLFDIPF